MRTGIIVRANKKGLGTQTLEAARNYPFDRQLLVLDGNKRWPEHEEWYPDAIKANWDWKNGYHLEREPVEEFLSDIDALFTVETLYDPEMPEWCARHNVKTVIQGNPEFYRPERPQHPDRWVWPTSWMLDHVAPGEVVPVPSMISPYPAAAPEDEPFTIVHVAGHRPVGDRNGTDLFVGALRRVQSNVRVKLVGQDGHIAVPRLARNIQLEVVETGVHDRWQLYEDTHLLVTPRRYGGLSLPVVEALSAGCAVAMSDCSPNQEWPIFPMISKGERSVKVPLGVIRTFVTHPNTIARAIDALARDRARLADLMERGEQWARTHSWQRLHGVYSRILTEWE